MKNNKGISLTSTVIYVAAMLIVVGIVGTITNFFYRNTQTLEKSAEALGEFNKFNAYFLNETEQSGNKVTSSTGEVVISSETYATGLTFSSGVVFNFDSASKGIYRNKVKICSEVKTCGFKLDNQDEKQIVTVYLEIGEDFAKTMEYVIDPDNTATANGKGLDILPPTDILVNDSGQAVAKRRKELSRQSSRV